MDYEQKYEEVLGRVKELLDSAKNQGHIIVRVEDIENAFPEIQESEDEGIRKWIIDDIRYNMNNEPLNNSEYKKEAEKAIAWLEKQDHMLDPDKVIEWLKHCNITDCDMHTSIIPDSSPTSNPHRVRWFSEDFIEQFKKDFEI